MFEVGLDVADEVIDRDEAAGADDIAGHPAKKRATRLSYDDEVGVKCILKRGCFPATPAPWHFFVWRSCRDVSFDEDKSRIRDNPGIVARARTFGLNIMRINGIANEAKALWNGTLSLDNILAYQGI
jgi:hypothetical protein